MHRSLRLLSIPALLLCASSAWAQTITGITPGYGGAGPHPESPASFTITGTGFSTMAKVTRFVDVNRADVLSGVVCTTSNSCTATGVRPFRVSAGSAQTLDLYVVLNDGPLSATHVPFVYYGDLVATTLTPNVGPYDSSTSFTATGGPFTFGSSFPGTTTIIYPSGSNQFPGGCTNTTSCAGSAPPISINMIPMGAASLDVRTPGGRSHPVFIYGSVSQTPATPTITGISAPSARLSGGDTVTITGTNFIPGTQSATAYGVLTGTTIQFVQPSGTATATGVNCSSTTTCTAVVPAGGQTGPADIQVFTVCPTNTCAANPRPSISQFAVKSGIFAYPGIKTSPIYTTGVFTSEMGHTATYQVSLYTQPTANVHVAISTAGGGASPSPASLDFTPLNWAKPQTVTMTGLDDPNFGTVNPYSINNDATSSDPNYNLVSQVEQGNNIDNENKVFYVSPQVGLVTTRAGGSATFTMTLSQAPSSQVIVSLISTDPQAGTVSPATLTFDTFTGGATGWNTLRTVTVTGHNDGTPGINRPYTIIVSASSGDSLYTNLGPNYPANVSVTNIDVIGAPGGLALTRSGPGAAFAGWTPLANADYYNIKYSTTPGGAKTTLASVTTPGNSFGGLTIGQQYYFVISAVNGGGESSDSAEVPFKEYPAGAVGGFDGDLKSEMTYYSSNGSWHMLTSTSGFQSGSTVSLGGAASTPAPGDYDGDQRQDAAVYNQATGTWNILTSSSNNTQTITVNWGGPGYIAVPGDYDGDGRTDPAVYRLSDGQWSALLSSTNYATTLTANWGGAGYTPIPGFDFDGDLKADFALYQQSSGMWFILKSSGGVLNKSWGGVGYTLVPGDYDGDGKADLGLYQRLTGNWYVLLSGANYTTTISKNWGGAGYLPIPADFDGDGKTDLGLFEKATGNWYVLLSTTNYTTTISASAWGTSNDRILSAAIFVGGDDARRASDFDGDGRAELTVYNFTTGPWSQLTSSSNYATPFNISFGGAGYTAVPGDYDGDGKADVGVYQQSTGNWSILLSSTNFTSSLTKSAGGPGWIPVPGDYDGDGRTDFVAYNTTTGQWFGLKSGSGYTTTISVSYGGTGYTAVPADFDGDAKTDIAVYQTSTGNWSVLLSSTNFTTSLTQSVGGTNYVPVPGDYDGDGKADFVVYNLTTGLWYGLKSSSNYTTTVNVSWGGTGYAPVKGDFDGDGKMDLGTYVSSTGTFYILLSGSNYTTTLVKPLGGVLFLPVPFYP
jgi:hypothetical protein